MAKTELPAEIKKLSFEDALEQLEKIVDGLETGEGKLDQAIQSYERGALLKRHCEAKLKEAQAGLTTLEEKAEAFPDDVKEFFAAVGLNRARLRHLTPEVLEWLDAQDLSRNVRVSFVTSS